MKKYEDLINNVIGVCFDSMLVCPILAFGFVGLSAFEPAKKEINETVAAVSLFTAAVCGLIVLIYNVVEYIKNK